MNFKKLLKRRLCNNKNNVHMANKQLQNEVQTIFLNLDKVWDKTKKVSERYI